MDDAQHLILERVERAAVEGGVGHGAEFLHQVGMLLRQPSDEEIEAAAPVRGAHPQPPPWPIGH